MQTSLFELCIQCSCSVACSCTVWRCLHLSCPMVIDTFSQAKTKDLIQLRDRWCFLCSTSGVRQGWCPFQVLCQRKESREPRLTLQGLDHCQAPPTQEGTWLRLRRRLLLHSLWGITLSSAAPSVASASPDRWWARLWRTSELGAVFFFVGPRICLIPSVSLLCVKGLVVGED